MTRCQDVRTDTVTETSFAGCSHLGCYLFKTYDMSKGVLITYDVEARTFRISGERLPDVHPGR